MKILFIICSVLTASFSFAQTGNVGIGTTNPTRAKFEVYGVAGTGGFTSAIFGSDGAGISLQRNFPTIGFNQYNDGVGRYMVNGYAAAQYLNVNDGGIYFDLYSSGNANSSTSGSVRTLTLLPPGIVGIRGGSSSASLTVARGTGTDGTAMFQGSVISSHFNYSTTEDTYIRAGKNGSNVYLNDITGGKVVAGVQEGTTKFGINAHNPTYTLEVVQANNKGLLLTNPEVDSHNWELNSYDYGNGGTCLALKYDNSLKGRFKPTDGGYSQNSDSSLKTNIQTLPPLMVKIMQLKPVKYEMKYNNPTREKTYGFIAQDVKQLFPEMVEVKQDSSGKYDGVKDLHAISYAGFSVLAIKAIQEQELIIEKQNNEISDLKVRLERLEKLLANR